MNTSDIRARIVAVLVGVGLFLFVAFVPSLWFGDSSLLLFMFDIATYGVAGIVFGFIWPSSGWRLGLYLFAVWPLVLVGSMFFAWEQPVSVKAMLLALLGYLLTLVAACVGGWLGSLIARRVKKQRSGVSETIANSGASGRSA